MAKPENLLYAETHEWASLEGPSGSRTATVGITAYAVELLTDLVFMQLPEVGTKVTEGAEFGVVESVKAVSPLYSPVDGEIVEVNGELPNRLETLNSDPFGEGWMIKVKVSAEPKKLMDFASYQKQIAEGH
jgi:glycine cleavage system H protein